MFQNYTHNHYNLNFQVEPTIEMYDNNDEAQVGMEAGIHKHAKFYTGRIQK